MKAAPQAFKERLNNSEVRVLEYTSKPGDKEAMHLHPAGLLVVLHGGKLRYTSPDGKSIAYVDTRNLVSNIWVLPLATMKPSQLTHFDSGLIANFAWSKDGKNLVLARGDQTNDIVLLSDTR